MSADETTSTEKKGKAGDEQFKFLIACIRHGVNGKVSSGPAAGLNYFLLTIS